jgi:hypothetical protein
MCLLSQGRRGKGYYGVKKEVIRYTEEEDDKKRNKLCPKGLGVRDQVSPLLDGAKLPTVEARRPALAMLRT